jgi:hypothetical protein
MALNIIQRIRGGRDLFLILLLVVVVAAGGFFGGRYYERRNGPQVNLYVNRFDCTKQGAQEAKEVRNEVLKQESKP